MATTGEPKTKILVGVSKQLSVIWAGVFGWSFAAAYLIPQYLLIVVLVGLASGVALTAVTYVFALKWLEISLRSRGGGERVAGITVAEGPIDIEAGAPRRR